MAVRACLGAGSLGRARAAAFRAGVLPVDADGFGAAVDGLHKAEHQADANIAALARRIWVGAAPAAKAAEAAAEQVAEQVAQVHAAAKATAEPAARARAVVGVYACMAKLVIPGAFIFIAEDLVCLAHLFELFLSGLVAGVQVRVIFFREFAVGALDLVVRGRFGHAEYLVIIAFICHCTFSP